MADKASNVVLNFKMDGQVQYAKTIKDINSVMNAAAKEYKNHVAAMGKDAKATDKLAAEKKKLEIQMEAAQERTKMLREQYDAMANDSSTTTAQLANMHGKLLDSERAEMALEKSMVRVNEGLSEQAEETRQAEEALSNLEQESESLEQQSEKLTAEYELQKAQLGENASESDKLALEMDHLSDQHELAGEKVDNLEEKMRIAEQQYGESSEEANAYELQLIEAQTAEQELANEIVDTNEKLKDQNTALEDTATALDNAGKKMRGAGKGLSKYVTAPIVGAGAAAIAAAKKTGDYAAAIKISADEAGIGTDAYQELAFALDEIGLGEDDTSKALGRLNQRMGLAQNGSDKYKDALGALGISYEDLEDGTYSTDEAFMKTIESLEKIEDADKRAALASELYGTKLSRKLLPAVNEGSKGIQGMRNDAVEAGKVMDGDALDAADEFSTGMDKLTDKVSALGRDALSEIIPLLTDSLLPAIEDNVIPAIDKLLGFVEKAVEWFSELSPGMQQAILIAAGLAAALGPLLIVLGFVASGISALIPIIGALGTALMFLATNPIGAIITVIGALIIAGIAIWKNWDTIKEKALEIWGAIKDFLSAVWEGIKAVASSVWNSIKDTTMTVWNAIKDFFIGIWDTMKSKIERNIEIIKSVISAVWNAIKSVTSSIWEGIKSVIFGVWDKIKAGLSIFTNIKDAIVDAFQSVKDKITGIWEGIWGMIKGFVNLIIGGVNAMIRGLNKLSFDIPDWVPDFAGGGKSFGVNIPEIPKLDVGTNFVAEDGLAFLHQGEAVVPKEYNPAAGGETDNGGVYEFNIEIPIDGETVAKKTVRFTSRELEKMNKSKARSKGVIA